MSVQALGLTEGMANAGYAFGAVLAVQLAQLLPQRRMLLLYGTLLVIGSVLAAAATGPAMFIAGHILQGLCTSLLLIAVAPPLFLGFPAARLRWSAVIMNMCLFGAVTAGPLIGGAQASFHAWRPLFWIVAGIAAMGLVMSLLTFQDAPPADRAAPRDPVALGLAASGSVAAFWGASEAAGFRARGLAVKGAPTWKAISDVADEHDASLIVLGSRGRAGLGGHLVGSVAGAVAAHSRRAVLIVHDHGLAVSRLPVPAPSASPSAAHRPHERAKDPRRRACPDVAGSCSRTSAVKPRTAGTSARGRKMRTSSRT